MKHGIGKASAGALFAAAIAVVLAGQPARAADAGTPGQPGAGDPAAGAAKAAMCIGCHGIADYRAAYPAVYSVPLLGGQNQQYLEQALREYRGRERHFAPMNAVAGSLTDRDIADLAAYYAAKTAASPENPDK